MSPSSLESGMARRDPNRALFAVGWGLTLLNLALAAWAVYVPIGFMLYEKDILFSLETATHYGAANTLSVVAAAAFALLQIFFLGKLARRMTSDTPETAAAEAALKIARATAVLLAALCFASLVLDIMYYRKWTDYYEIYG